MSGCMRIPALPDEVGVSSGRIIRLPHKKPPHGSVGTDTITPSIQNLTCYLCLPSQYELHMSCQEVGVLVPLSYFTPSASKLLVWLARQLTAQMWNKAEWQLDSSALGE